MGDDVSSGSLPSFVLVSEMFAFNDQMPPSMLRCQCLVISVGDQCYNPCLSLKTFVTIVNLIETVFRIVSLQRSVHVCGKIRLS